MRRQMPDIGGDHVHMWYEIESKGTALIVCVECNFMEVVKDDPTEQEQTDVRPEHTRY